jgi:hypothetical protein
MKELNQFCEHIECNPLAPKQLVLAEEWNDPSMQVGKIADT